ncbi:MAG: hypothetical protein HY360_20920 [Verrucomicrobia bacterium]|nr:hypothetical protein [Verrucomicrobiota bacterium]
MIACQQTVEKTVEKAVEKILGFLMVTFKAPMLPKRHGNGGGEVTSRLESRLGSHLAARIMFLLQKGESGKTALAKGLGHKTVSGELHKQIKRLLQQTLIAMTIPSKPNSRLQKYRLTATGEKELKKRDGEDEK